MKKDKSKAFEWYSKAADNDDADAMFKIGECYSNGDGVAKDKEKAFEWYLKAAQKDYAQAAYMVGKCYQNGVGVTKDLDKAEDFYEEAKRFGCDKGKHFLKKRQKARDKKCHYNPVLFDDYDDGFADELVSPCFIGDN